MKFRKDCHMSKPLISVIVPIYNVEQYLDKCITSIVNQSYKNLEIILVDDGATDKCPDICDKWAIKDDRIVVIHKENGGLSDARNSGLNIAKGEYISFIDSDDWIDLNFYEVLYNSLLSNNAQISASEVLWVYDDHQKKEEYFYEKKIFSSEEALQTLIRGSGFYAIACNKLYKATVFDGIRFPVGKLHEDEFVVYKLIDKAESLVLCKEVNYYYRQRQGSITKQWSIEHLDVLEAYFERSDFLKYNYPNLYIKDKVFLLLACIDFYKECQRYNIIDGKKRVLEYSKRINFSINELINLDLKSFFRIVRGKIFLYLINRNS